MTLRIGHGNGHNKPSLVQFVRRADADSHSCLEAQRLLNPLEAIPGTRLIGAGEGWTEERNRAKSLAIVTKNKHPNIGELTRKVSEKVPAREKFAPDRVLVASFYEHPVATALGKEGVAHFALHPDATVMRHEDDHPIVREYAESMISTHEWMRTARRDGLLLFLTMDAQVNARFNKWHGPRARIARPLGLQARFVGIDAIFFDRDVRLTKFQTRKLYDHTGFVASFVPRRSS